MSALIAALLLAFPVAAQEQKPVTDKEVTAEDVISTPMKDLNLTKDDIPAILARAQANPYDLTGISTCENFEGAVAELNAILGPDFDVTQPGDRKYSLGGLAQSLVTSFIPFRGIIREVSGAKKHEQEFRDAIMAGMMRRSYLKGVGQSHGCQWPATPADAKIRAQFAQVASQSEK